MAAIKASGNAIPRFLLPRLSWTPVKTATWHLAQPNQQRGLCLATTKTVASFGRNRDDQDRRTEWLRQRFSSTARRARDHHFDTLKFVQKLKEEGHSEKQAAALLQIIGDAIEESIANLTRTTVLREDQDKATYTQKVDFAKLRSEVLSADSAESALTRSSHERLTNDVAKLNSRLRDEIQRTLASCRLDLNLEKGRIREEANSQDLKIKEVETRIEQEAAAVRERLEQVKFSSLQWMIGLCTGTAAIILGVWRLLM